MDEEETLFKKSVETVLKNWTGLQLAVCHGGSHSAQVAEWMVGAVVQWFEENKNLEQSEVAEFLETILNQELDVLVQDESTFHVSKLICEFHQLCAQSQKEQVLEKLRQLPQSCDLSSCKVQQEEDEEESEPENASTTSNGQQQTMEVDSVDPDGWTVVSRKKK